MALFKSRDALDGLEDLLDRERKCILKGEFDKLHRLVAEKERLLNSAKHGSLAPDRLAKLSTMAKRNQQLLDAAGKGIRSVSELLKKMQNGAPLSTYDRAGSRKTHSEHKVSVERRA
ncbi:MAG: hypothetical protein KUG69_01170 [Marinosulfonomonas sp.]|nr:hypothetical protein [Marinosulfonomonas sp.]